MTAGATIAWKRFRKNEEHTKDALERFGKIDRAKLSPADQLNYDLFKKDLEEDIAGFKFRRYLLPINQRGGIQTADELGERLRFETVKDYEDWIARLRAFPTLMEQNIALMQEGAKAQIMWPKIVLERVPSADRQANRREPGGEPVLQTAQEIPEGDFRRPIGASAPGRAGGDQGWSGPVFSKAEGLFRRRIFAGRVSRSRRLADAAGRRSLRLSHPALHDDRPDAAADSRERSERSRSHPARDGNDHEEGRFQRHVAGIFHQAADAIPRSTTRRRRNCSRPIAPWRSEIDPNLVKVFKTLPRTPYGVIPIPDKIAPDTTTAYYSQPAADGSRAGNYYVNLYKPETRPKWEMMALSLHEAVPGHHLQIALAQELGEIPKFRRYGGYTAFMEGWGLYAESLGEDMGLYDDPYAKFGQLTYEMWRAVRLVVDTGMHFMKWDRQRAIDFFMENAAKVGERHRQRNRSLHLHARPGARLQNRRAKDQGAARTFASARSARASMCVSFTTPFCSQARFPWMCWSGNVNAWIATKKGASAAKK